MIFSQIELYRYAFITSDQDFKLPQETPLTPPEAPFRGHLKPRLLKIVKMDVICFIQIHFLKFKIETLKFTLDDGGKYFGASETSFSAANYKLVQLVIRMPNPNRVKRHQTIYMKVVSQSYLKG